MRLDPIAATLRAPTMRALLLAVLVLGCRKATPEVRPDNRTATEERVKCSLPEADPIATTVKVPARCDLTVTKPLRLGAGGALEIGPGAKLLFARGSGITVEGGVLTARGTAKEPVVFTSAESKRAPGDWSGLVFNRVFLPADAGAPPGESVLEHAVVEFAGAPASIVVRRDLVLDHVKVRHGSGFGVQVHGVEDVKKLANVTFEGNSGALDAPPSVVAMLGEDPGDTVQLHGSVASSVTLPKLGKPYVAESISVRGPATLTIADDTAIKFLREGGLSIHGFGAKPATLVAHRVTFTSALDKPAAGDWRGLSFDGDAAADLDSVVVEYSGCASKKCNAIHLPFDDKKIKIVNSTFRNNPAPALGTMTIFGASGLCAKWNDPALKNKSIGQPMCEEPPDLKIASLGVLGGLGSTSAMGDIFGKSIDDSVMLGAGSLGGSVGGPGAGIGGLGGVAVGGGGGGGPTKPTSVVTETSISATGGLPADVVRKVVRSRMGSLRACHARGDDSGTITVTFSIDAKGSVTSASASSFPSADVTTCVTGVFKAMHFPESESGDTTSASATHKYSF